MSSRSKKIFDGWHEPTRAYDETWNLGRTPPPRTQVAAIPCPPAPTIKDPETGVLFQPKARQGEVRPLLLSLWNHYNYLTDWLARDLGVEEETLDRWRLHAEEIDATSKGKIRQLYAKTFPQ